MQTKHFTLTSVGFTLLTFDYTQGTELCFVALEVENVTCCTHDALCTKLFGIMKCLIKPELM